MYYIYDECEYYVCRTDSFYWAKKIADRYCGFVEKSCPFDGTWVVYDTMDYVYDFDIF